MKYLFWLGTILAGFAFIAGPAQAHTIVVDGNDNDWVGIAPGTDSYVYSNLEFIWTDAVGDDQGDCGDAPGASDNTSAYTYPTDPQFLGTEADVKEWRVTADPVTSPNKLYFLIRIDYDLIWMPFVGICVDLDHVSGSGQSDIGGYRGRANVHPLNEWEYLIQVRNNVVVVMDSNWNTVSGSHEWFFSIANDLIEVGVDVDSWPISPWDSDSLYFNVYAGLQDFDNLREVDSVASQWQGGGGLSTTQSDPCVYDLCFVTALAQCGELNGYTDTTWTSFSLDACQAVDPLLIGPEPVDTTKPRLVWVEFWTCDTLVIHYNEPMDSASAVNQVNYTFAPSVNPNSLAIFPPYRDVMAYLQTCVAAGIDFSLTVDTLVTDAAGNGLDPDYDSAAFGIAEFTFRVEDTADANYAPGYLLKGSWNTRDPHSYDPTWGMGALYQMYDDGFHGDGAAGDHIWGAILQLAHDSGYNTWEWGVTDLDSNWIDGNWQFNVYDASPDTLVYVPPEATSQAVTVTFNVDMSNEGAATYAGGVSLEGSRPPLDWDAGNQLMADPEPDSVYTVQVTFPQGTPFDVEFKFTRSADGVSWDWEQINNRRFTIDDSSPTQVLPTYVWGYYGFPTTQDVRVHFFLNMSAEPDSTYAGGVSVQGDKSPLNWIPGSNEMEETPYDKIYTTSVVFPQGTDSYVEYKYTRRPDTLSGWEWEPIFNRSFYIIDADTFQNLGPDHWSIFLDVPDVADASVPEAFLLDQNYPNPFNPETKIEYRLPEAGLVRLTIYNVLGQTVRTLIDHTMEAGFHQISWDGRDDAGREATSGIYFYRIVVRGQTFARKMVLLR